MEDFNLSDFSDDSVNLADYLCIDLGLDEGQAVYVASCAEHFIGKIGLDLASPLGALMYSDVIQDFLALASMYDPSANELIEQGSLPFDDPKYIAQILSIIPARDLKNLMRSIGVDGPLEM